MTPRISKAHARRPAGRATGALVWAAASLLLGSAVPAGAAAQPGRVRLISVGLQSAPADGASGNTAFSEDMRFVAFSSVASNLVPGDTNGAWDVFVLDRSAGQIERVSVASDGSQGNDYSSFPSVSADGRFVAFESTATNLVDGDTNGVSDIFVRDRSEGTTEIASASASGAIGDKSSHYPSISADGRLVSFYGGATNLVLADLNDAQDVFVRDLQADTVERVSVGSGGQEANNSGFLPSMSADGRYVVWESYASNLVALDRNFTSDIFLRDRQAGTTQRVSVSGGGAEGNEGSLAPSISADGSSVAFTSYATNLVPADANGAPDVFVRDLETGGTELVSVASTGVQGTASALFATFSADGRYVAFESRSTTLVPNDTNGESDVFVHDRVAGVTTRISVAPEGGNANGASHVTAVSPDGRLVGFRSAASNLVPGDTNGLTDVFLHQAGGPIAIGGLATDVEGDRLTVSGWTSFAPALLSSAADASNDAAVPVPDAEVTRAGVVYRPEEADLIFRLRLASLENRPGLLYGTGFSVSDERFEVRALTSVTKSPGTATSHLALYRCDVVCEEAQSLVGAMGAGATVTASVPLSAIGAAPGGTVRDLRSFSSVGEAAPGGVARVDEVALPEFTIPQAMISIGVAREGTPEGEVAFGSASPAPSGSFALSAAAPPAGRYDAWVRACLASACAAEATPLTIGG